MKKGVNIFVVMLVMVSLLGCPTWKRGTEATYKDIGILLEGARVQGVALEQSGKLSGDKLIQTKLLYSKARTLYRAAADVMILAAQTEDVVKQKDYTSQFDSLIRQAGALYTEIMQIYSEVK